MPIGSAIPAATAAAGRVGPMLSRMTPHVKNYGGKALTGLMSAGAALGIYQQGKDWFTGDGGLDTASQDMLDRFTLEGLGDQANVLKSEQDLPMLLSGLAPESDGRMSARQASDAILLQEALAREAPRLQAAAVRRQQRPLSYIDVLTRLGVS